MNKATVNRTIFKHLLIPSVLVAWLCLPLVSMGQDPWKALEKRPPTLGLEKGISIYHIPDFTLKLVNASQTVAALIPSADTAFDFTPGKRLKQRSSQFMYQLGDLNLRLKTDGDTAWTNFSTAASRKEVMPVTTSDKTVIAAADLSGMLPADMPLKIARYWLNEDGKLVMQFKFINTGSKAIEIGSIGLPMIFNNILQDRTLDEAHAENVFYDPYIGMDAGYLQVTRLNGHGPALLVVPDGKTPFEAYNPLLNDPTPRGMDFEGFYEWMACSKAYAEKDWKNAQPWNVPTSIILQPGETREIGLKFILSDSIKGIEQTLADNKRPVAIGVPGYVLPQDIKAKLFLRYPQNVKSMSVEPAGAMVIKPIDSTSATKNYEISGVKWGRARLTIVYADGLRQTISYKVINPETQVVRKLGHFLFNEQWYTNKSDPFGRDQSVITYDYEKKQQVTQDQRVWIAGLSDEGGSGSWLAAVMKEYVQPDKAEVKKLERFVNHTLWGNIQYNTADTNKYGVKKSVFYYEPTKMPAGTYDPKLNWKTWAAWSHKDANDPGRAYNYPHVVAAHWVLYRLARYHQGLVTEKPWQWYLDNAYQTTMAMMRVAPYYTQFGLMEGDIFFHVLEDLKNEGWTAKANLLEAQMKLRAEHWHTLKYPFGSEMPWDSTGQEEVYTWLSYFGYTEQAESTIDAILGYMPTIPHWGYNGSARRYWDFLYGGKLSRIERQLHHYGSGLNAIPVLSEYRKHPDDLYLLRVGYGGLMGSISNITEDGFGPAAFHSFPSTLKIDGLSGDYGPNFFGYAINSCTYITHDPSLGWLAFGGDLTQQGKVINVKITNGAQSAVYIASIGLRLRLDAGTFKSIKFNAETQKLTVVLNPKDAATPAAFLRIDQPGAQAKHVYKLDKPAKIVRGAYYIHLQDKPLLLSIR